MAPLAFAVILCGVIMTPLPEHQAQKLLYADDIMVYPAADETPERTMNRWMANYCRVIQEPCSSPIPFWAGWGNPAPKGGL